MDLPNKNKEIDARLRRRYLDRLNQRMKRLRKLVIERNWDDLKSECSQLATSGETFGFDNLTHLAVATQDAFPKGKVSRAATPTEAKEMAETLISAIDAVLIEHSVLRN